MNFLRMRLIFIALLFIAASLQAQSLLALREPLGLPVGPNSGMSKTMGGVGVGLEADNNIMLFNPANLGSIEKTVFSALYSLDLTRYSQSGAHSYILTGVPQEISIGIPFGKFGVIGAALEQQSNEDARFQSGNSTVLFGDDSVNYQPGLLASGGIISWQIGWGRVFEKLGKLKLGLTYERVYFSDVQSEVFNVSTYLNSTINSFVNSRDSTSIRLSTSGLRLGVMAPIGKLNVGVTGEYFFSSTANVTNGVYAQNDSGLITGTSQSATIRLAPTVAFGASYVFSSQWLAAADLSAMLWNYYKSGGVLPSTDRKTSLSFSVGGQYIPAPNVLTPKYWEIMNYRAGLRYSELPQTGSEEYALNLGVGLPTAKRLGMLDVGLEIGRRLDTSYPGYAESFFNISLGISGGHKWNKSQMGNY